MPFCEKCGNKMNEGAMFCKGCGEAQGETSITQIKTREAPDDSLPKMPIAGGIMVIIGALFCFIVFIYFYLSVIDEFGDFPTYDYDYYFTFFIILAFSFIFGFYGGTLALSRKYYGFSLFGALCVIVGGFIGLFIVFLLGLTALILGVLGLIFIALSKHDFKQTKMLFKYQG